MRAEAPELVKIGDHLFGSVSSNKQQVKNLRSLSGGGACPEASLFWLTQDLQAVYFNPLPHQQSALVPTSS